MPTLSTVIMAGGKGIRMKPFTDVLPKPLVPINNKPIIEHIIENFLNFNQNKFFLTISQKSKILKYYFKDKIRKVTKLILLQKKNL